MSIINIDLGCKMRISRAFRVKRSLGRNQSKPSVPNKIIACWIKIGIVTKSPLDTCRWTCYPRVRSPFVRVVCVLKFTFVRPYIRIPVNGDAIDFPYCRMARRPVIVYIDPAFLIGVVTVTVITDIIKGRHIKGHVIRRDCPACWINFMAILPVTNFRAAKGNIMIETILIKFFDLDVRTTLKEIRWNTFLLEFIAHCFDVNTGIRSKCWHRE